MKFCKDCKHMLVIDDVPRCAKAPKGEAFDPVTGKPLDEGEKFFTCDVERAFSNGCGPRGTRFEAKVMKACWCTL